MNNRPASSGINKRSNSSVGALQKNVASVNLYGHNTTVSGNANPKSYNARPTSSVVSHSPAQYIHLLGQTVANKSASSNVDSPQNINVQLPGVKASTGSCATFARPRSAGMVDSKFNEHISSTDLSIIWEGSVTSVIIVEFYHGILNEK